jgi:hypothetical protein
MPWGAIGYDLEPTVRASILRESYAAGPAWLAPMSGTVRPSEIMNLNASSDSILESRATSGIWKGPVESKVHFLHT